MGLGGKSKCGRRMTSRHSFNLSTLGFSDVPEKIVVGIPFFERPKANPSHTEEMPPPGCEINATLMESRPACHFFL